MKRKNRVLSKVHTKMGFTLIEMVIVVGVILILALMAFLTLNPIASIDKAYDAQRKKDLESLRISFENYYSDYSCYPTQDQIDNCSSDDLNPYLSEIPCDPVTTAPYELIAEPDICPQNFIAYTQLKRQSDPSVDDFNCYSVKSPNIPNDQVHDCTEYFDLFVPSGTPTPSPSGTPTPSPSGTPTPDILYYYCSSLSNCTELPDGKSCDPNFPWPDTSCSGACINPSNICTPQ